MEVLVYTCLLLVAVATSLASSEFISNGVVNIHEVRKRSIRNLEEEDFLPRHVFPNSYKLQLQPYPLDGYFYGEVHINISCQEPTDTIVVHADRSLEVELADRAIYSIGQWDDLDGRSTFKKIGQSHHYERIPPTYSPHSVEIYKTRRDLNKQWYEMLLDKKLQKGVMYLIKLEFFGNITVDGRKGFYLRNYKDNNTNEERWHLTANLYKNNARKVFPCFDEPSFKSTIQLNISLPSFLKAITTMPLASTVTMENGWRMDYFEASPPMAVQSFGIFVFNPTHIATLTTEQVFGNLTIYGHGQENLRGAFQSKMKEIVSHLANLQKFLGIGFPLREFHLVALPVERDEPFKNDFWGAILFSERELILEDAFSQINYLLPKQWIGHLVTPDFNTEDVNDGLVLYLSLTNLMFQNADNTLQWTTIFAPDIYAMKAGRNAGWNKILKSAFVWRMLNYTLTQETLGFGIYSFLCDKAFNTYSEDDIFESLSNQAWLDGVLPLSTSVTDIAKSWLAKEVSPVVSVLRDYKRNSAALDQNGFVFEMKPSETVHVGEYIFWIPITYITRTNLDVNSMKLVSWMRDKHTNISDLPDQDTFIIVNPMSIGMYLVNYDQRNWHLLWQYIIKSTTDKNLIPIPGVTRSKLLHDAMYLAMSSKLDYSTALNMTLFMRHERDPNPWVILEDIIEKLSYRLHDTPVFDKFLMYCRYLCASAYNYFENMEVKGEIQEMLSETLTKHAAEAGFEPALEDYKKHLHLSLKSNSSLSFTGLCAVLRWSDEDWEKVLQNLLDSVRSNETTSNHLFSDLVWCNRKPENLYRVLYLMFLDDEYKFSKEDMETILYAIHDYNTLLTFISKHWNLIKSRYGDNVELWNLLFEEATKDIKTKEGLELVSQLYHTHHTELQSARSIVSESLAQIPGNLNGKYHYVNDINTWLDLYLPSLSTP